MCFPCDRAADFRRPSSGQRSGLVSLTFVMPLPAPVWFVAAFIPMVASQVLRLHHREGFRVPLVERAVEIVQLMRQGQVSGCVFPRHAHGRPLSNMALLTLLKRMNSGEKKWLDPSRGRPIAAHGFRATFRTRAEEVATVPHAVIEQAMGIRSAPRLSGRIAAPMFSISAVR